MRIRRIRHGVHERLSHQAPDRDQSDPGEHQRPTYRHHPAAPVPGQRHSPGEGGYRQYQEDPDDRLEEVEQVLHVLELVGLEDHEGGDLGRKPVGRAGRQPGTRGHLFEELLQVERHTSVGEL